MFFSKFIDTNTKGERREDKGVSADGDKHKSPWRDGEGGRLMESNRNQHKRVAAGPKRQFKIKRNELTLNVCKSECNELLRLNDVFHVIYQISLDLGSQEQLNVLYELQEEGAPMIHLCCLK